MISVNPYDNEDTYTISEDYIPEEPEEGFYHDPEDVMPDTPPPMAFYMTEEQLIELYDPVLNERTADLTTDITDIENVIVLIERYLIDDEDLSWIKMAGLNIEKIANGFYSPKLVPYVESLFAKWNARIGIQFF